MNALPPYPTTQETGIPWLGRVPAHWEVSKLRNVVEMRVSNVDKNANEDEVPVRLCNYVDVYKHDRITDNINFMSATATQSEIERFRLRTGDVLITKDSEAWDDIGVPALVEYSADDLVCGYHLALLRPRNSLLGKYLLRVLQEPPVAYQFHIAANGVTRYGLTHSGIKTVVIPLPPPDEQDAIARYLDWADSRIRRLIRARQQQIKLLEEYKQAVIQQAVTGQIDVSTGEPYPAYKDSGVAWLGQVPEHWDVVKLGHGALSIQTGPFGSQVHNHDYISNGIPLINPSHMKEGRILADPNVSLKEEKAFELSRHLLQKGDIIVARRGELGRCALVTENESGWLCGTGSLKLQLKPELFIPNYILLILGSQGMRDFLKNLSVGSTMDNLNASLVARLHMPKPPITEQQEIIDFINKQISQAEQAVAQINSLLKSLQEYRTRLIADVVTGKVDVRQAAAQLPAVEEELQEGWEAGEVEDEEDFEEADDAQQDE